MLLESCLDQKGYREFLGHKKQVFDNKLAVGGKQYAKQVYVGKSIYETNRKCDYLIFNQELFPDGLIIECKWQESPGTVDEKYPYQYFNIIKTGVPTVFLLDGEGYRKAALQWLKSEAHDKCALNHAWNMKEFQENVDKGFLG